MRNPDGLYELVEELPELGQPVLIQALSGFIDAGGGVRLAREHLLETGSPTTVARFDLDQLLDYRSRRPTMLFVEDHWESYEELSLSLHLLHDRAGTPYLLLTGPEPDLRWEGFTTAVIQLVERLGVRLTVGLGSIPMAVPHTRPTGVTAHATRPELILERQPWRHRVQVPASVGHLLEFRLGKQGHDALGFVAHVPHYLAQSDYPAAAETLLHWVSRATGLVLPTEELHRAADTLRVECGRAGGALGGDHGARASAGGAVRRDDPSDPVRGAAGPGRPPHRRRAGGGAGAVPGRTGGAGRLAQLAPPAPSPRVTGGRG